MLKIIWNPYLAFIQYIEMIESIEIKRACFFFYLSMIKGQTKQRSKEKGQNDLKQTLHRKLKIKQHKAH